MNGRIRSAVIAGATAAVTLIAWVQLSALAAPSRLWTAALLVPLPVLMLIQAQALEAAGALPRRQVYVSSIVSLLALLLATLAVSRFSGYAAQDIGLAGAVTLRTVVIAATLAAAGVAVLFAFRFAGVREALAVRELLPRSRGERLLFVFVSITAGICEEIIFRGFLLHALDQATGSAAAALVLSSGAFGVVHAYQKSAGALRAALLGAILAAPILLGHSLHSSILAHALIDVLSGLWLARYLLR
ncbi:MAG: CPBP family intramembrane glutamic endopeptidase [Gemmatimonadota bacterium]